MNIGRWLAAVSCIYLTAAVINYSVVRFASLELIQAVFVLALLLPLLIPKLGHRVKINPLWGSTNDSRQNKT